MPIGEIVGEVLGGVLRVVAQVVFEIVFEVLIKGTGYALAGVFKRDADPDGALSICLGLIFWVCVGCLGYVLYRHFTSGTV